MSILTAGGGSGVQGELVLSLVKYLEQEQQVLQLQIILF